MRLYSGMSGEFIRDTTHNRIADKLSTAFFDYYRYRPSPGEVNSWRNSLRAMSLIVQDAKLDDHGVILEYQLPQSSKRLDCMLCSKDSDGDDQAVIVELKQWEDCKPSDAERLLTWVGGGMRDVLHPSAQVGQYAQYLSDTHTAFQEDQGGVDLHACAYLHNYDSRANDPLLDTKFSSVVSSYPLFDAKESEALSRYLSNTLSAGDGRRVLQKIEDSKYRPSKKLMDQLSHTIKEYSPWVLLDEQLVVYEKVRAIAKKGLNDARKRVVIVKGGPGTGKSVLAVNLVGDFLRDGVNAQHATGSKAFTSTIREILGGRSTAQFKYFNNYGEASSGEIDLLVCDEAHRLRKSSNTRFTKKDKKSTRPQIEEIIGAAKTCVFFIDDLQLVRPEETGSIDYITEHANRLGCELSLIELDVQFRCGGSDGFINWIDNTLAIRKTANVLWNGDENFDFQIVPSVEALEQAIRSKVAAGVSARLVAGYCWPWSDPTPTGQLINDVEIGEWKRPWNARPDAGLLAPGIPPSPLWAYNAGGVEQVGCVYTAQGFEFDYVGVIWGADLVYRFDREDWNGDKQACKDNTVKRSGDRFADLVKNTYRVLLSRGLKGCYVYFTDKETERFVRSRIERMTTSRPTISATTHLPEAAVAAPLEHETDSVLPFKKLTGVEGVPLGNCVRIVDFRIAAGGFSPEQWSDDQKNDWAELPDHFRAKPGHFVAQVFGASMNRKIPNGSWCLFAPERGGTRNDLIVIAQHQDIHDADTGSSYTIKQYRSKKNQLGESEGEWEHTLIELRPLSFDESFKPIVLVGANAQKVRVVGVFVAVL